MHVQSKFNKTMSLSSIHYMLRKNNITRLVPRPIPAKGDKNKKLEFKKDLAEIVKNLKTDEQIFFQDESTFYQSGIPRKKWAIKGSTPELLIYGTRARLNVFGIVNPITGKSHF